MNQSVQSASAPPARGGTAGQFADLHLHTLFSDGTFTPEELAERGARLGLVAMALTDHDTIEGCERMSRACEARGMECISGAELTAEYEAVEVHLLGYFLDLNNPKLLSELRIFQSVRQNRIHEIVWRLNRLHVPLRAETVFGLANCAAPGRPHVGRALVQEGLCETLDEAFERFLKKGRPAWVPKHRISALEAIELIHQAGGLAVMAHPGLNHNDKIIAPLAQQGLDGLECFHTKHTASQVANYLAVAERLGLAVSGGSDCHGFSKGKPAIGGVKLPVNYFEKLKERHQRRLSAAPIPVAHSA